MNKKIFVGVMLTCLIVFTVISVPVDAKKTVTIVDSLGNMVKIPYPVERVVNVNTFGNEVIVALGGEDKLVGIDMTPLSQPEFYPTLQDKPTIGLHHFPNYEMIIDLNPQVVIYESDLTFLPGFREKIEKAGITPVCLNLWDPATYDSDIRNLGIILGKEERAEEYLNFSHSYIKMVEDRVRDIPPDERVRVYWESPFPYTTMAKGSPMDKLIGLVRGTNVFSGAGGSEFRMPSGISAVSGTMAPEMEIATGLHLRTVSQEAIVEANPQVIIGELIPMEVLTVGGIMMMRGKPYLMPIGYTSAVPNPDILKNTRDKIMSRPGSMEIDAVKNDRVHSYAFSMLLTSARWPVGMIYLAKNFYPDRFEDVDPDEFHAKWLKEWQGLEYKGLWVYP